MGHFQIFVSGAPGSVEDWREALNVPDDKVPQLDQHDKDLAKRLQIDEKEYGRGVLADHLSQERNQHEARLLGERVDAILQELNSQNYQLSAVLRNESTRQQWVVRIITPQGVKNVEIPPELLPGVNGGGADLDAKLRIVVLAGVGRGDSLEKNG